MILYGFHMIFIYFYMTLYVCSCHFHMFFIRLLLEKQKRTYEKSGKWDIQKIFQIAAGKNETCKKFGGTEDSRKNMTIQKDTRFETFGGTWTFGEWHDIQEEKTERSKNSAASSESSAAHPRHTGHTSKKDGHARNSEFPCYPGKTGHMNMSEVLRSSGDSVILWYPKENGTSSSPKRRKLWTKSKTLIRIAQK